MLGCRADAYEASSRCLFSLSFVCVCDWLLVKFVCLCVCLFVCLRACLFACVFACFLFFCLCVLVFEPHVHAQVERLHVGIEGESV